MPTYLDLEIKYGAKQNNTKVFEKWAEVPRGRVPRPKPLCRYGWVYGCRGRAANLLPSHVPLIIFAWVTIDNTAADATGYISTSKCHFNQHVLRPCSINNSGAVDCEYMTRNLSQLIKEYRLNSQTIDHSHWRSCPSFDGTDWTG